MNLIPSPQLFPNKTIVVAIDFLESSRLALDYAIGFAHKYQARLILVHAIELSQPAREAEMLGHKRSLTRIVAIERLEALAAGVRRLGFDVTTCTDEGEPRDVLIKAISSAHADLLVLGTHGIHRGIGHLLLGSNVEKLLMDSPCPTLSIGRHVMSGIDLNLNFNEVLYVSDFSAEAAAAAPVALLLGRDFSAPVDVCQMVPDDAINDPLAQEKLSSNYFNAMRQFLPDADHYWSLPTFTLERASMIQQVLDRSIANNAGIIVLGIKQEAFVGRHLHTSFAYKLLAYASCPILTVRRT